jgi:hypothetical protein
MVQAPGLTQKTLYYAGKRLARDKRSSLLWKGVTHGGKKFYKIDTRIPKAEKDIIRYLGKWLASMKGKKMNSLQEMEYSLIVEAAYDKTHFECLCE